MQQPLPYSLSNLLSNGSQAIQVDPITNGLIHQTFRIQLGNNGYLLQSINTNIFSDPTGLIRNHQKLYDHFLNTNSPFPHPLAEPLPFPNGQWLFVDEHGKTWRISEFIPDSYTRTSVTDTSQSAALALFFAKFSRHASSMDRNSWHLPIPRFHDLAFRFEQFQQALENDRADRKTSQHKLINQLQERKDYVDLFSRFKDCDRFPLRMMHHDAKLSNVLIDQKTETWLCPIDLDTVMPGYFFSDLGDMIRSICNGSAKEDSPTDEVVFHADLFESLLTGYRSGMEDSLTPEENNLLGVSGILMTYMQSLRFLTDYLNGDIYYHTNRPAQNLDRTLNQLELLSKMETYLRETGRLEFAR